MAAGANLSAVSNILNGGGSAVPENSAVVGPICPSVDWTRDEQSLLEELLAENASDSKVMRYAKVALHLPDKTIRDVALRCRWMTLFQKKENGKQRKDDVNSTRKNKDKREKNSDKQGKPSSNAINHADGLRHAQSSTSVDNDDDISITDLRILLENTDIGTGVERQILEQNTRALEQISANISAFKAHENIRLLCQTRNNIAALLNDVPQILKRMPPLSEKVDDELFISALSRLSTPVKF